MAVSKIAQTSETFIIKKQQNKGSVKISKHHTKENSEIENFLKEFDRVNN